MYADAAAPQAMPEWVDDRANELRIAQAENRGERASCGHAGDDDPRSDRHASFAATVRIIFATIADSPLPATVRASNQFQQR